MSKAMDEAVGLMKATDDEISRLMDQISDDFEKEEDHSKANKLYVMSSYLDVFATTLSGEEKVYEGPIEVNNQRACVSIDGFEVRGNVQFEILDGDRWIKGHRQNSQYGQVFMTCEGASIILTSDHRGRVTLPLVMDKLELWN